MEESDERYGESDVSPFSLYPSGDLPKEIKVKTQRVTVVVSEGDSVPAWAKACI